MPFPLFQTFTYSVPEPIRNGLTPGCRVLVPFGNRHLIGLATKVHHESRLGKVKPVRQILDREPLLSPAMLKLGLWMASYYLAPPGEALRVMFPPGLLTRKVTLDQGWTTAEGLARSATAGRGGNYFRCCEADRETGGGA